MAPDSKPKVVVVEDDAKLRKFLEVFLSSEDYAVFSAGDGDEGLELVRRVRPQVVISDVLMQSLGGFELLQRLRADPATAGIPLIFLTAKTAIDDRVAGFNVGADDYVIKPFAPAELISRIKAVIRRAAANHKPAAETRGPICAVGKPLVVAELFHRNPQVMLAGQLSAVSLIDVLQSISGTGMTGRLEVCGADHGLLEMRAGQIVHAQVNTVYTELIGLKAWFRLACWTQGAFEFNEVDKRGPEPRRSIETALQNLLMDAAYYRDEVWRVRGMFPPINFELHQQRPLEKADPIDRRVWQTAGEGMSLDQLLDTLDAGDLEILQSAFKLMMAGNLGLKLSMM
jgi:CheY-like chemotaxis protein